jgi:hypothetical protein
VIELDRLEIEGRVEILGALERLGVLIARLDMLELLGLDARDRELEIAALRLLLLLLLELPLLRELLPARTGPAKKTIKQRIERIRDDGGRRAENGLSPPVFCRLSSVFRFRDANMMGLLSSPSIPKGPQTPFFSTFERFYKFLLYPYDERQEVEER